MAAENTTPFQNPGQQEQSQQTPGQPASGQVQAPDQPAPGQQLAPNPQAFGQPAPGYVPPEPIDGVDPEALAAMKNLEERRKRKRRKRIIIIVVVCLAALLLAIIGLVTCAARSVMETVQSEMQTAVVTRSELSPAVQATGNVKPGSRVAITPEVAGIVQDVRVVEGQHVEAGDVLFTLKNTELEKSVADARSALDKAHQALNHAQASVDAAWTSYNDAVDAYNRSIETMEDAEARAEADANRAYSAAYDKAIDAIPKSATKAERKQLVEEAKQLAQMAYNEAYAAAGVVDPGSFDHSTYTSAIDTANSAVVEAEGGVSDAQRSYNYAVEEADKRTVRAPVAGTLLALSVVPGSAVGGAAGGTSTAGDTLAEIGNLASLSIDIEVNEIDVSNVTVGQRAQVSFTAVPDLQLEGSVTSVASVASGSGGDANAATGSTGVVTYKATVAIDHPDERLKPGMSASVKIATSDAPSVLVVPAEALIEDGASAYVLVVRDGNNLDMEQREVVVGERSGSQVAIDEGLEEGETVVTSPAIVEAALGSGAAASSAAR